MDLKTKFFRKILPWKSTLKLVIYVAHTYLAIPPQEGSWPTKAHPLKPTIKILRAVVQL